MRIHPVEASEIFNALPDIGQVTVASPSNIALVKYWGKRPIQLPENPSVSFTLDACRTVTTLSYKKIATPSDQIDFEVLFDGVSKAAFKPKIAKFLERIKEYVPWITAFRFTIDTRNTFPHSSGIASSASGMSALALCLMQLERSVLGKMNEVAFQQKVSYLARLGSGSACRSTLGPMMVWGRHDQLEGSTDQFAVKYPLTIHEVFKSYHDTILLIDKGEKQVSSTVGHDLMHGHPFASQRFEQAHANMNRLITIFAEGDLDGFIEVVESEALTLHAMMMTSLPYFILMKPHTLTVINKVWSYRKTTGAKLCFTLDAGANVHLLYPENEREEIMKFIQSELTQYCQNGHYICDKVGLGAKIV